MNKGVVLKRPRPSLDCEPVRIALGGRRKKKVARRYGTFQDSEGRIMVGRGSNKLTFFISDDLPERMEIEIQPLTLSRLIAAIIRNFYVMSIVRFYRTLQWAGMLRNRPLGEYASWRHITFPGRKR